MKKHLIVGAIIAAGVILMTASMILNARSQEAAPFSPITIDAPRWNNLMITLRNCPGMDACIHAGDVIKLLQSFEAEAVAASAAVKKDWDDCMIVGKKEACDKVRAK